jgi:hypothetical protein
MRIELLIQRLQALQETFSRDTQVFMGADDGAKLRPGELTTGEAS